MIGIPDEICYEPEDGKKSAIKLSKVKCNEREEDLDADFLEEKRGSVKALKANSSPSRSKALISSKHPYA